MKNFLKPWEMGLDAAAEAAAVVLIILLVVSGAQANSIQVRPYDEQHATMTAEQAARAFFDACGRKDWDEVGKFWPMPMDEQFKKFVGGLKVLSLGQSFKSAAGPSLFVPYKIRLSNGEVKKHNLALRNDNNAGRWFVDGGL